MTHTPDKQIATAEEFENALQFQSPIPIGWAVWNYKALLELIEKLQQENSHLNDLRLHRMEVEDGAINFSISGEPGMAFAAILVKFFEDNGGKNFFSFDMKRGNDHFSINIQKVNGQSPTEKMNQQAEEIKQKDAEIEKLREIQRLLVLKGTPT
jgi:hypothetical protein